MLDSIIHPDLIERYQAIPLKHEENTLFVGVTSIDPSVLAAIGFHTGMTIRPILLKKEEHHTLLNKTIAPDTSSLHKQLKNTLCSIETDENKSNQEIDNIDEPVTQMVNQLFFDAIQNCISDIHIEPLETSSRIRYRRDGILYEAANIPLHLTSRIITRLKILSNLDIAEQRLPQDGRIQLSFQHKIDIRISTCPTLHGEKIVLRLLNNQKTLLTIDELGLSEKQKSLFLSKLNEPQGLILVTGPTGSGKTITLYSALNYLNRIEKNILSIEDPIEIELIGINQISVNTKIGLDFATILRSSLRQDPDIIMIGEIRDIETAKIAMQAAQTGHLVLATLHANSAAETLSRLKVMGVDTYSLISAVSLIIAQRLIRLSCQHCSTTNDNLCHQEYHGRIGIFEFLPITKEVTDITLKGGRAEKIVNYMQKTGWETLRETGLKKVQEGVTTFAEVARVITS